MGHEQRHLTIAGTDTFGSASWYKEDILAQCIDGKAIALEALARSVPTISAQASVLDTLVQFKRSTAEMMFVVDQHGNFHGLVTRADLLQAIAGEFPHEGAQG